MVTRLETSYAFEDPRMERTRLHSLGDIMVLSLLVVLTGGDGVV